MNTIDLSNYNGLEAFANAAVGILNTNLQTITKEQLNFTVASAAKGSVSEIMADYPKAVIITASESSSSLGIIFNTSDITAIADLMLMGTGEPKEELNDDLKDAIKEICSQFFGGLDAMLETQHSVKFQIKVNAVETMSAKSFKQKNYYIFDLKGEFKGAAFKTRIFIDEAFASKIDNSIEATQISGDIYKQPDGTASANMEMLLDIEVPISVRMGATKLFLKDVLGLGPGNIVELNQNADEPIELTVNDKLVARGEVVIVDGYFGFRIKEIISKAERLKKLKD